MYLFLLYRDLVLYTMNCVLLFLCSDIHCILCLTDFLVILHLYTSVALNLLEDLLLLQLLPSL